MAYAAFADAPVDAAVVEVGMGGPWDATNVADGQVAVVTPIAVDHAAYLGDRAEAIAAEKSGIIKPGSHLRARRAGAGRARRRPAAAPPRSAPRVLREGIDFGVADRLTALGGQQIDLQGVAGRYDRDLPAAARRAPGPQRGLRAGRRRGVHRLARSSTPTWSRDGVRGGPSPGRLEVVRRSPTVLLDAAHNPHGIEAALEAVQDAFTFSPLIGVVGVMADKDVEEIAAPARAGARRDRLHPEQHAAFHAGRRAGRDRRGRVRRRPRHRRRRLDDAIERAIAHGRRRRRGPRGRDRQWGVLITGSVVTVGEARLLFGGEPQ